jgi:hypothetical protein
MTTGQNKPKVLHAGGVELLVASFTSRSRKVPFVALMTVEKCSHDMP